MTYAVKPMPFDPQKIKGLSEKILISHYENNYGGAVKRLNQITAQLAGLDYDKAPGFLINGLKREELIATNSMILHEFYFAGLGEQNQPSTALADAIAHDFGTIERWRSIGVDGINFIINSAEVLDADEARRSMNLFAEKVMPRLKAKTVTMAGA